MVYIKKTKGFPDVYRGKEKIELWQPYTPSERHLEKNFIRGYIIKGKLDNDRNQRDA